MALTKITGQVINDTTGLVVGVTTVGGGISATDGFFSGIVTAVGDASFSGNVSVGGTLTYEDVTNIDAVGLVTARNGIVVGSGITLSKDGDIFATGVTTSTTFVGNLTGNVTGNADTATNSTNSSHILVTDNESTNENNLITFVEDATSSTGNVGLEMDGNLTYNPSTGTVSATAFSGDGSALTGIGGTDFIHAEQINNSGVTTTGKLRIDVNSTSGTGSGNVEAIFLRNTNETDGNAVAIFGGADDYSNAGSAINFVNVDHSANVGQIQFDTRNGSNVYAGRIQITSDGHLRPVADNVYDIGSSSLRFRNIYTGDLHCSNKGSSNDVDGTWGDYTIQEGESDLFLINNRSGKKYKFNLTEVS